MRLSLILATTALVLVACAPPVNPAGDIPKLANERESFGGRQCSPVRPLTEPDLMAWDSGSRANLKRIRQEGLVVVRYHSEGCVAELELLPNCNATGSYKFSPYSANEHKLASTEGELFAELPLGAARLQGKLKGNRAIRTDYMLAGLYALPRGTAVQAKDLSGPDCERATHIVNTVYVGAFVMGAGESRAMQGGLSLLGGGVNAMSAAEVEVLSDEGNAEACRASQKDGKEDDRCGVPLRIGLLALAANGAPTVVVNAPPVDPHPKLTALKLDIPPTPPSHADPRPLTPVTPGGGATCSPADWSSKVLKPLLRAGSKSNPAFANNHSPAPLPSRSVGVTLGQQVLGTTLFMDPCEDRPKWTVPSTLPANSTTYDGISFSLLQVQPAGNSGRNWAGGKCSFGVRLASGAGNPVTINDVLPFNGIGQVVRGGSAVYMSMNFNGYAREFPRGGNYVIASDACDGSVKWRSASLTSGGPIMLVGDYLVTGYGFTEESRFIYVLNAHTGAVVQKIPTNSTPAAYAIKNGVFTATLDDGTATFELLGP